MNVADYLLLHVIFLSLRFNGWVTNWQPETDLQCIEANGVNIKLIARNWPNMTHSDQQGLFSEHHCPALLGRLILGKWHQAFASVEAQSLAHVYLWHWSLSVSPEWHSPWICFCCCWKSAGSKFKALLSLSLVVLEERPAGPPRSGPRSRLSVAIFCSTSGGPI